MTVEWKDGKPVTTPTFENGCFVFRTTEEDQKRIAEWNWKAIYLLAAEIQKRREG